MSHEKGRLTEGPIGPIVTRMTIPMIWGVLAVISFNFADTYFISRLGTEALVAISFTFPVVMVLFNLAIGFGIGLSSTVARAIGEGNKHKIQHLTTSGLLLAFLVTGFVGGVGFFTIDPVFQLLGADQISIDLIREYMQIFYISIAFLVVPMAGNAAIRSTGDAKSPAIFMIVSAILNIILDPMLIFGFGPIPELGIKGAAIASVISRVLTFIAGFWILGVRERMLTWKLDGIKEVWHSWKQILSIAIPAAATNMIIPVVTGVTMKLLADFGNEPVAAFGVASRIEAFAFIIMYAISSVVGPIVGQNWGAGLKDRVVETIHLVNRFCIGWGLVSVIVFGLSGTFLAGLFNKDPGVIVVARHYFWIVPIAYAGHGIVMMTTAVFNALGKALYSAGISFTRFFIFYIPLAIIGKELFGVNGIFFAFVISSLVTGVGVYVWAIRYCRK